MEALMRSLSWPKVMRAEPAPSLIMPCASSFLLPMALPTVFSMLPLSILRRANNPDLIHFDRSSGEGSRVKVLCAIVLLP